MADEQNIQETTTVEEEVSAPQDISTALMNSLLGEGQVSNEQTQQVEETTTETESTETTQTEEQDEVFDEAVYVKNKFGKDSADDVLNELKELREKAEKTANGFEFKNEDSKKIAEYINEGKIEELTSYFDTQRKVDKLLKADLSDKKLVEELVKFNIHRDNIGLGEDDINFLFEEKYSIPKEPKQRDDELEEDFNERHAAWNEQRERTEKRMIIEAKIAQPKLAQLKSELVLPEIKKEGQQIEQMPTQEDLEAMEKEKATFLQSTQQTVNAFSGFNVEVKDKDVNYTVNYAPSAEEKLAIGKEFEKFAQSGFNANALFKDRWYDATTNTFKHEQMVKDLSRMFMGEKAEQKLVIDAVGKRMDAYIEKKKNVNITGTSQRSTFSPPNNKSEQEVITDAWLAV